MKTLFHPPYRPTRRMNPWAALLAGLFAVVGIEALASQALSPSRLAQRQVVAPAAAVVEPRREAHIDAVPCERQPFCTLFHCY